MENFRSCIKTKDRRGRLSCSTIGQLQKTDVADYHFALSGSFKSLVAKLDRNQNLSEHVQNMCDSWPITLESYFHVHVQNMYINLQIRSSIMSDLLKTVACALINSRFDYAKAWLIARVSTI